VADKVCINEMEYEITGRELGKQYHEVVISLPEMLVALTEMTIAMLYVIFVLL